MSYTPLHDPERDVRLYVPTLQLAIDRARKVLDEKALANIHDHDEMLRAATSLDFVLRDVLAALGEVGER
ncbi:hypothetical protein ACWEQP_09280 [Streptomyces sp. NPDC004044]